MALAECGSCHRDHIVGSRVPAGFICDGCDDNVPEPVKSCGCRPACSVPSPEEPRR